ncbi:MAG: hypothetical protein ACYDCL_15330 [Myxococcales bacterium]
MLGLCLAACRRAAPDSPEYEQAFKLYTQLYSAKLDDSYGDPRMQDVLTLLGQVDPASARAAEAKELQTKVEQGVADFRKRQEKVAADEKAAEAPAVWPSQGGSAPPPPPGPPASGAGPALGMTRDDFLAKFGACFDLKGLYQQGGKRGEAYAVKPACAGKYAALADSLVVLLDGRVDRQIALSDVTTLDAGTEAAAPPPAAPKPKPAPPPPPPKQVRWMPGAPHPEAP